MERSCLPLWEWSLLILLVLLAWTVRVWAPIEVPPGWRDDELINIYALSERVLEEGPILYFTGASGHEPLFHNLHAAVVALMGGNPLGAHFLSIACGTLTVPLIYVLGRRLLGRSAGIVAGALLAFSFWSLMYSRIALRHMAVLPPVLGGFYLLWTVGRPSLPGSRSLRLVAAGLLLSASIYTYTVARMVPVLLLAFGGYLLVCRRERFRAWWRPLLVVLIVVGVTTPPLWIAIRRGHSEAAVEGIGADARIAELSVPLREMRAGNFRPFLENARTTLGMFHATGDPEWLYNLSGRPVFGLVGAVLFFAGLGLCLWRWRRPECAFLLIWLAVGLSPALVTLPPASLGHTILAQPPAYLLVALALSEIGLRIGGWKPRIGDRMGRLRGVLGLLVVVVGVGLISARDLRAYFVTWPERGMVRFLYRADYRRVAQYLDANPQLTDVAVGSALMGPWDRMALEIDLQREDVDARLFDPERALLAPAGPAPGLFLTHFPDPEPALAQLLEGSPSWEDGGLSLYGSQPDLPSPGAESVVFVNGLGLEAADWPDGLPESGTEVELWLTWRAEQALELPEIPVVANPPPPGVYSGPRLSVFAHLFAADGTYVAGEDGLAVDPTTLRAGDRFVQIHRFALPADGPPGPYRLEVGVYDPLTGERWLTEDGADRVELGGQ